MQAQKVSTAEGPAQRRMRVARRIRSMREQAGMTLTEAAKMLDKTRSSLSRLETGQSKMDVHLARSMMLVYDRHDPDLLDLVRHARSTGGWAQHLVPAGRDRGYTGLEADASGKVELCLVLVPALLQTEAYARAVAGRRAQPWTAEELAANLASRADRRRRLTDTAHPLDLVALVDEAALRKDVGGPEVMREQLRHLVACAGLPTVTIQVLPDSLGAHAGTSGALTVLSYPDDDDVLYLETATGSMHVVDAEVVAAAGAVLARLRSEALSPAESVAFLERMAGG